MKTVKRFLLILFVFVTFIAVLSLGTYAVQNAETCIHNYIGVNATQVTPTSHGTLKHYYCDKCGSMFLKPGDAIVSPDDVIVHYYDRWEPTDSETDQLAKVSDATCTKGATYLKKCTICGVLSKTGIFEYGELSPHKPWENWTVPMGADCTKASFTRTKNCMICGEAIEKEYIPVGEHDLEARPQIDATCFREGRKAGLFCRRCYMYTVGGEVIPIAHRNTTEISPFIEPTCTEYGRTASYICNDCQTVIPGSVIEKKPHLKKTNATCVSKAVCRVCGNEFGEINPNNHAWGNWKTLLPNEPDEATVEVRFCSACGAYELREGQKTNVQPQDEPVPDKEEQSEGNFFQRIIEWFRNLFARLFGR